VPIPSHSDSAHSSSGDRRLDRLTWGPIPHFTTDTNGGRKPTNTRAETVAKVGLFRGAFASRRGLVPASEFYEWATTTTGRRDAVLAREIEIALPRELSQAEAIRLAQDFVRSQFVARGMVADLAVHWGTAGDGTAQPHAHVLLTMRAVIPGYAGQPGEGCFGLKERAWNDKALLRTWREHWAGMVNERLAEAGHDLRIDHRSHADRGLDLAP